MSMRQLGSRITAAPTFTVPVRTRSAAWLREQIPHLDRARASATPEPGVTGVVKPKFLPAGINRAFGPVLRPAAPRRSVTGDPPVPRQLSATQPAKPVSPTEI